MASHFSLPSFLSPPPSQPKTVLVIPFSPSSQNLSVICSAYSQSRSQFKSSTTRPPKRYNREASPNKNRTGFPPRTRTRPPRRGNGEKDRSDWENFGTGTKTRSPRSGNGEKGKSDLESFGTATGTKTRSPNNLEERKRHWKAGEFPGLSEERFDTDKQTSYENKPQEKKKHWKVGEFPGVSVESSATGTHRKGPPIKNVKKKMEKRERAKAWVCTVTEALSDRIQAKNWIEALEV